MQSARSRLILASPINGLSFRKVSPEFVSVLDVYAFQELWLIRPGDIIITPRSLPNDFVQMVVSRLGLTRESFICLSPEAYPEEPLLSAIFRIGMLPQIRELVAERPGAAIRAFALEPSLVKFSSLCGLPIEGYGEPPTISLLRTIDHLNTKSGFRIAAEALGLPVAPGLSAVTADDAERTVHAMLSAHDAVILKCDRGSGASAQFRLCRADVLADSEFTQKMRTFIQAQSEYGHTFVVEALIELVSDPSVDLEITEEGPRVLYVGAMDCTKGSFQGMRVPASEISSSHLAGLHLAASRLGDYLFKAGYRGFFDIDAGVDKADNLYLFETNVRRTSTSLWDSVLRDVLHLKCPRSIEWQIRTLSFPSDLDVASYLASYCTFPVSQTPHRESAETLWTWARSPGQTSVLSFTAEKHNAQIHFDVHY